MQDDVVVYFKGTKNHNLHLAFLLCACAFLAMCIHDSFVTPYFLLLIQHDASSYFFTVVKLICMNLDICHVLVKLAQMDFLLEPKNWMK